MSGIEVVGIILGAMPLVLELFDHSDTISKSISMLSDQGFAKEMNKHRSRLYTHKALFQANADQIKTVLELHQQEIRKKFNSTVSSLSDSLSAELDVNSPRPTLEVLLYSCRENLTRIQSDLRSLADILSKFQTSATGFNLQQRVQYAFRYRTISTSLNELQGSISIFSSLRQSICTILNYSEKAYQADAIRRAQTSVRARHEDAFANYRKVQHASLTLYETIIERWHCANHDNHIFRVSNEGCPSDLGDKDALSLGVVISPFTVLDIQEQHLLVGVLHGQCTQILNQQPEYKDPQHLPGQDSPDWIQDFSLRLEQGSRGAIPNIRSVRTGKMLHKSREMVHLHANVPIKTLTPTENLSESNPYDSVGQDMIDLQMVDDLCEHFEHYQLKDSPMACLGYLQDHCLQRFFISPADQALDGQPRTLEEIISASAISLFKTLPRAKMIELARSLANVVLQFHETPWLPDRWDTSNISVFCTGNEVTGAIDDIGRLPYVTSNFGRLQERKGKEPAHLSKARDTSLGQGQSETNPDILMGVRNMRLFCLGIALLELGYSEPWNSLRSRVMDTLPKQLKYDYYAADKLAKELTRHMGFDYARVILKCIGCDFGLGIGECDFSNELLQEKYLEDVVDKLKGMEENMNKFLVGLVH